MSLFDEILTLSKKIAKSILGNEKPTDLEDSELFDQEDKHHILKSLTDTSQLKERQQLQKQIDTGKDWKVIQKRTEIPVRRLPYWKYASAAAVFIGVLTLGYFYQQGAFDSSENNLLVPTNESITLQLEDGTIEVIDPTATKDLRDKDGNLVANQSQTQLRYDGEAAKTLVYNTLTVPYGKRFDVVLSDGTIVYMNSGTELKYPVSFLNEGNREIFVQGEAYFDVASDAARPFIVNAEELNVEVLGTEFNVLAYPEDGVTDVVLVEGSVGMYADDTKEENTVVLTP
ncbi:MAG: FecR family protein [Bacteroidota bacterium]